VGILRDNLNAVQPKQQLDKRCLIEASGLGVNYVLGNKREDIQSLAYNTLFRKRTNKVFWALKNIDLTCFSGDILGIIGSNGAGKTTLCKVVSGLLRPDAGEIRINGKVASLLSLGTGFNPQLSGRENVFLNGMMLGLSKRDCTELLPEIIRFSGLEKFIDQPIKHYSSGMKARLGFSIAAMLNPEILVVDEALSVGDLEFQERAAEKMQEIVSKANMVMVVTHQVSFVEKYCNRAIWIDKGSIKASGLPSEVVSMYKDSLPRSPQKKRVLDISLQTTKMESGLNNIPVVVAQNVGVKFFLTQSKKAKNQHEKTAAFFPLHNKKTRSFWALEDVSFSINEGEIVGIIGPNGAGKSTLCKVLSGILKADKGEVYVKGNTTALLSLGMGFNEQLTGRDNIYLNGMMLGISKKRLQLLYDEIVNFSGLMKFMEKPIKYYSSGMKSRLAFSIAAIIKPDVFIIDEVLSVGDAAFYEKASAKIQEMIGRAKAVIVVTHNMMFVDKVCTRGIWLENGTIKFDGSCKEAVAMYKQSKTS
jgi:teichoic acid transport system ATP-binding protein